MASHLIRFKKTPWWTFYADPKATYTTILNDYPRAYNVMMAMAIGFAILLQHLFNRGLAAQNLPGYLFLEAFILGPFLGLFVLYLSGWLLSTVSARVGGAGDADGNRTVWVWSFVPYLSGVVLLWIPLTIAIVVRGILWFRLPEWARNSPISLELLLYYAFIPFWGWSLYLFVLGLTVVNRYSWRYAIITTLVAYITIGLVAWLALIGFHVFSAFIF